MSELTTLGDALQKSMHDLAAELIVRIEAEEPGKYTREALLTAMQVTVMGNFHLDLGEGNVMLIARTVGGTAETTEVLSRAT